MRYAILGDIHANLEALAAVVDAARANGADRFLSVGDIVGYNANPSECMALLADLETRVVRGNHDEYAARTEKLTGFNPVAAAAILWTRGQLTGEERGYLGSLPLVEPVDDFVIVHATLDHPDDWGYILDRQAAESSFGRQEPAVCFFGHTHVPLVFQDAGSVKGGFYRRIRIQPGARYLINVGSVGQPRDGDPRAAYVIYDTDGQVVELFRVEYDIETTQRKIRDNELPERLALRLEVGR